jgi:hypothetical protein
MADPKWTKRYQVIYLGPGYYAGQGQSWETNDIYTQTFTWQEAQYICELMNSDEWAKNDWAVKDTTDP